MKMALIYIINILTLNKRYFYSVSEQLNTVTSSCFLVSDFNISHIPVSSDRLFEIH